MKPLRILIVEDDPLDLDQALRELRRAGFDPEWKRVDTEVEFAANLRPDLDVILSDYALPCFSGKRALEVLLESGF
jgi:CheY-like chemotaxis protein